MLSSLPVVDKPATSQQPVASAVLRLDAWLQTMRSPAGFGGPISHWWESSLLYCGPMSDWRYEGILSGYTALFEATRDRIWLERAEQAAGDVLRAQLPSGSFLNSSFQYGPIEGGTPHEASVDVGLLELAHALRRAGSPAWQRYFQAAERNIEGYLLGALWNGRGFQEQPWDSTLVPNKNATAVEALLLYEELSGRDMHPYTHPAVQVVLSAQEHAGSRAGGIVHLGTHAHRLVIGIYTARSASGLLRFHTRYPSAQIADAVGEAMRFLNGLVTPDGTYFGYNRDGTLIANPRWIAPSADLLRAAVLADRFGLTPPGLIQALVDLLIRHQTASGGLPTAYGFARRGESRAHAGPPEFRDVLPVAGWCDKAFRALSLLFPPTCEAEPVEPRAVELHCTWKGKPCAFVETAGEMRLQEERNGQVRFRWRKGQVWPDVYAL